MRKLYLLFALLSMTMVLNAQWRDGTCDPIDSLLIVDTLGELTLVWHRNDTALAYNYRFRELGELEWETNATLDSFFTIDDSRECVEYEVSISTVCPFDTSTYTLDTVITFCPSATRNLLANPDDLVVYPIPLSSSLTVSSINDELYLNRIVVRNIEGQMVTSAIGQDFSSNLEADIGIWPSGIYLLEVETNKGWHFQKILKL